MAKKHYIITVNGYTHADGAPRGGSKLIYDNLNDAADAFICAIEDEIIRTSELHDYRPECPKVYTTLLPDAIDINEVELEATEESVVISVNDDEIVLTAKNTELTDDEKKVLYAGVDENGYIEVSLDKKYRVNIYSYSNTLEIISYD